MNFVYAVMGCVCVFGYSLHGELGLCQSLELHS